MSISDDPAGPATFRAEQLDLLYRESRVAIPGNAVGAGFLAWGLWPVVEPEIIAGWFGALAVVLALRLTLTTLYFRRTRADRDPRRWLLAFTLGAACTGIIWGVTSGVVLLTDSFVHIALQVLILLGIGVAGIAANAAALPTYMSFVLPALVPTGLMLFTIGSREANVIGVALLIFVVFLVAIARLLNRTLGRALELGHQREELTDTLSRTMNNLAHAKREVGSEMNDRLRAEEAHERSEQRFEDFAQSASDFLWEMDADLRFSYFSDRFEAVTGVSPTLLLGKTREDTGLPEADPQRWRQHLDDLHAHRPFRNFVHPRTLPDGTVIYVSINGKPIVDSIGRFQGYRGTGADVTERVRTSLALEEAKQNATAANDAKTRFLATVSHEIRTPLNAIIGVGEVMGESDLDDEQRKLVAMFNSAGEHLLSLVNSILDLSKIEAGEMVLERDLFDLHAVIGLLDTMFTFSASEKGLALSVEIADDVPRWVEGDRGRLEEVLVNLVGNALKFTHAGSVHVEVTAPGGGERPEVAFAVSDTGIGIAPAQHEEIFLDFIQADTGVMRRYGGTGLGLAICRRVVELMGGRIRLESASGEGSTFTVRVPLRRASATELQRDPVTFQPNSGDTADFLEGLAAAARPPRVLLVDDAEDNRLLVKAYLKGAAIEIEEACDGQEALDAFAAGRFDLVLMDIHMPVMNGYDSVRAIRERERTVGSHRVPIVALTADVFTVGDDSLAEAGFDAFMSKPIRKDELLRRLRHSMTEVMSRPHGGETATG